MNLDNKNFTSIERMTERYLGTKPVSGGKPAEPGISFQDILNQKKLAGAGETRLKFSKHAANRLSDRQIELSDEQMNRLNEGLKKAGAKGIQESLVLVDNLAFIINIKNSTVVTAMEQKETQENIFTNIDGAVII